MTDKSSSPSATLDGRPGRYVPLLVKGDMPEKQAAWEAFYRTAKSVIPHYPDGTHDGTYWVAVMEALNAYIACGVSVPSETAWHCHATDAPCDKGCTSALTCARIEEPKSETADSGALADLLMDSLKEAGYVIGLATALHVVNAMRFRTIPSATPFIHVGEYTVGPRSDGSFWIEHDSGEGMQVRAELLAEAVHAFYKEHF